MKTLVLGLLDKNVTYMSKIGIFKNMMCYESNEMTECNDSVNKELCLSVENANLTCRWYKNRC